MACSIWGNSISICPCVSRSPKVSPICPSRWLSPNMPQLLVSCCTAQRRGARRRSAPGIWFQNSSPCLPARREPHPSGARQTLEKNEGSMNKETGIRMSFSEELQPAKIKVIGVGGGGCNAVNRMIRAKVEGVEFIAANTDLQALKLSQAPVKLQLGAKLTKGLGAGANPEVGRKAALEDTEKIIEALEGSDMIFITAGLGGGTGSGAAPVVASLASELGALSVAVVTKPFAFEGKRRMLQAEQALQDLIGVVDTVIVIPNERLMETVERGTSFFDAFRIADDILRQAVQGISDIITVPGIINRDFADVKAIMHGQGYAVMGTAVATGTNRAVDAA